MALDSGPVQTDCMKRKPISRKNLWALAQSHMLGHPFTQPGQDRQSDDDDLRLSHCLLEAAVRCCIDANIDAADVAGRVRAAANQVDAHAGGSFELIGWNVVAHQRELAFAYLLVEQAIIVRLEKGSDPVLVGKWLRGVADLLQSEMKWPTESGQG
jgi:hypothetical protein